MNLREQIENYVPFYETEEQIKKYLLNWIYIFNDVWIFLGGHVDGEENYCL